MRSRTWQLGKFQEAQIYPVFQPPGARRARCKPTRECQQILNQREAERKAQRLILVNFGEDGMEVDLTFAKPATEAQARAELGKYIRKLRKAYREAGEELRYMYTCEKGKKSGRVHFHLLLNRGPLDRDGLEGLWPHGYANSRRLILDETGLAGISAYITKQGRNRKPEELGKRRWSCSRNLIRPEPIVRDGAVTVKELESIGDAVDRRQAEDLTAERWPGMTLTEATVIYNGVNRGTYIELKLAAPELWRGRPPEASYLTIDTRERVTT